MYKAAHVSDNLSSGICPFGNIMENCIILLDSVFILQNSDITVLSVVVDEVWFETDLAVAAKKYHRDSGRTVFLSALHEKGMFCQI